MVHASEAAGRRNAVTPDEAPALHDPDLPDAVPDEDEGEAWNEAVLGARDLPIRLYPSALLMRLASAIHQEGTTVYARRHGLSLSDWRILGRLHECAPVQLSVLCRVYCIDKGHAVRVLEGLSKRGLVKVAVDPDHKGRRVIDITPEGRALARRVVPDAIREQLKILRALSAEERRAVFSAIRKLLALYGKEWPRPMNADEGENPE